MKRLKLSILFFMCALSSSLSANEIQWFFNEKSIEDIPRSEFILGEALPPLEGIWKVRVTDDSGNISEKFFDDADPFLFRANRDFLVFPDGTAIGHVKKTEIWGEPLELSPLHVWISWEGTRELSRALVELGNRWNWEIRVDTLPKTSGKLSTVHRGGGEVPDLVLVKSDDIPVLRKASAIQPLDETLLGVCSETARSAFFAGDRYWALPFYGDTQLIYYNTEIWPNFPSDPFSCPVPELNGSVPLCWNAFSAYWLIPFQKGYGKRSLVEESGRVVMDDEPTIRAMQSLHDWIAEGRVKPLERDAMIESFRRGETGAILGGSYNYEHLKTLDIPLDIAPFPEPLSPLLDYKGWVVPKRSRNPRLARYTARMMAGEGIQSRFPLDHYKIPVNEQMEIPQGEFYQILVESRERGTVIPPENGYKIYKNTMWKLLRFVLTDQLSAEEASRRGQLLIDRRYDQYESMDL